MEFFFSPLEKDMIYEALINYMQNNPTSISKLIEEIGILRPTLVVFMNNRQDTREKTYARIYTFLRNKNVLQFKR